MDGEELVVPRVPSLSPESSARQIAEHEFTGHAVYTLFPREGEQTMAFLFVTEKMCCRSCVSNAETVQLDSWERQLLTGRVRRTTQIRS